MREIPRRRRPLRLTRRGRAVLLAAASLLTLALLWLDAYVVPGGLTL